MLHLERFDRFLLLSIDPRGWFYCWTGCVMFSEAYGSINYYYYYCDLYCDLSITQYSDYYFLCFS